MGFIDRLDDVLTDAMTRNGAMREAKRFSRSVKLNTTYYSVATHIAPEGGEMKLLHEHVFTYNSPITGNPMCGPHSAAYLWLNRGPLTERRPARLKTLSEYQKFADVEGPNINGDLRDYV